MCVAAARDLLQSPIRGATTRHRARPDGVQEPREPDVAALQYRDGCFAEGDARL